MITALRALYIGRGNARAIHEMLEAAAMERFSKRVWGFINSEPAVLNIPLLSCLDAKADGS